MPKCSYCLKEIEKGTGMMYVRRNGSIKYYCSTRCYKLDVIYGKKPNKKEISKSY